MRNGVRLGVLSILGGALLAGEAGARSLAVAWNDPESGRGAVAAMRVVEPFDFLTDPVETGPNAVLHTWGSRLYALSSTDATLTVIDQRTWSVRRTYTLEAGSDPQDVAVAPGRRAFITRSGATHLLRLDLRTGETTEVVDLGVFADGEGPPDLGRMAVHEGRLFVQLRRLDSTEPGAFLRPAMLAVVDLRTEQLVDVDPATPGIQAISLAGTPPRMRMQIFWRTEELLLSSTGGFFDDGGIEVIDLRTLGSKGLAIREADGQVGADLGAFVLVAPERGFLVFSTDLLLSSHLNPFDFAGHVGPELHVSLDYFVPALAHDRRAGVVFLPDGNFGSTGIRVFDAATAEQLTTESTPTTGAPTDLLLLRRTPAASEVPS